jgi:hypothetical protein
VLGMAYSLHSMLEQTCGRSEPRWAVCTSQLRMGINPKGGIFEDDIGQRHGDVGEYLKLTIKMGTCWQNVEQQ